MSLTNTSGPSGIRGLGEPASELTKDLINAGLKPKSVRVRNGSPLRLMATADGYVMVRHPGCMPFVLSKADWLALPEQDRAA